MKDSDLRYIVSDKIAQKMKGDKLFITFTDQEDSTIFELEGNVAAFLRLCDGAHTVKSIVETLKLVIHSDEDEKSFNEMISFLKQHQIIQLL